MAPKKFDRFMVAVELSSNPKIARLDDREFRCLLQGVWPLAAKARPRGYLAVAGHSATVADVANQARCPRSVATRTLEKLRALEMLERDDDAGLEHIHDWEELNPEPRHDTTSAERQRRFRGRRNAVSNAVSNGEKTARNGGEVKKKEGVTAKAVTDEEAKASSRRGAGADDKATEEDRENCRLLLDLATERNAKFKAKSPAKWLTDMRLLRERDGNSAAEIEQAIRWLFTDASDDAQFWADVIQSPANLRDKFPRIWAKMRAVRRPAAVESSADVVARMERQ